MFKYRKKPTIIEAWQHFNNLGEDTNIFPQWIIDACATGVIYADGDSTFIKTLEGPMLVSDGDWIIKGIKDGLYPCKPDIFEQIYDKVED